MSGEVEPFSAEEISAMLLEKFGGVVKDVQNRDKAREAVYKIPDLKGCESEELYYYDELTASKAAPLRTYLRNPTDENLELVVSSLGDNVDRELSPAAIVELRDRLEEAKGVEGVAETLDLQEKVLATPIATFKSALDQLEDQLAPVKDAPIGDEAGMLADKTLHYGRTLIVNDEEILYGFLKDLTLDSVNEVATKIIGCGFSDMLGLSTPYLGIQIKENKYLEEKGFGGSMIKYGNALMKVSKGDEGYKLRFFYVETALDRIRSDNSIHEQALGMYKDIVKVCRKENIHVETKDEEIESVKLEKEDWSYINDKMNEMFSVAEAT